MEGGLRVKTRQEEWQYRLRVISRAFKRVFSWITEGLGMDCAGSNWREESTWWGSAWLLLVGETLS
jgi:hypothetical protein